MLREKRRLAAEERAEKNEGDDDDCCKAKEEQGLLQHEVLQVLAALEQERLGITVVESSLDSEVE